MAIAAEESEIETGKNGGTIPLCVEMFVDENGIEIRREANEDLKRIDVVVQKEKSVGKSL